MPIPMHISTWLKKCHAKKMFHCNVIASVHIPYCEDTVATSSVVQGGELNRHH